MLLANQGNLLSALRVALLLLPERFTEMQLYNAIAGISYMGDPRMNMAAENPHKVSNIVNNQQANFRKLYGPLIELLPNLRYVGTPSDDLSNTWLEQDLDPVRRGNMVRRLPKSFRQKLYVIYQSKYQIPRLEFEKMVGLSEEPEKFQGGEFERRIASDLALQAEVGKAIRKTVKWPSTVQSLKGVLTAGPVKSWNYTMEKVDKWRKAKDNGAPPLSSTDNKPKP